MVLMAQGESIAEVCQLGGVKLGDNAQREEDKAGPSTRYARSG